MIRGIDSQVMINKTVDYSRQRSDQMQNIEHNKEFASQLQKSKVEIQNNSVQEMREAEQNRVNRQKNEQDDGSEDRKRRKKRRLLAVQEDADQEPRMTVEEEVMSRTPRTLPRDERSLGGSIDINI